MIEFSKEEQEIRAKIRSVYNSGNCEQAVEMSKEFLQKFPNSHLAKYSYAVMHGDFASDLRHSPLEKEQLLEIAKVGISELFFDKNLAQHSKQFQKSVKNEYYWFHQMYDKQYQLGIDELPENPRGGHYSACVGAAMLAWKQVEKKNVSESEKWAQISLFHFREFEKIDSDWYNINYFSSQAAACLGQYSTALDLFKAMFKKQKALENSNEVNEFETRIQQIKLWRGEC